MKNAAINSYSIRELLRRRLGPMADTSTIHGWPRHWSYSSIPIGHLFDVRWLFGWWPCWYVNEQCVALPSLIIKTIGAILMTIGMFLPAFSFTIIGHDLFERIGMVSFSRVSINTNLTGQLVSTSAKPQL